MTNGVAHVSFSGGGMFLPARSPYDRQLLAEHVQSRVRAKGQVQVLIDDQRWLVHRHARGQSVYCSQCGFAAASACYLVARQEIPYCVSCAFKDLALPPAQQRVEWKAS